MNALKLIRNIESRLREYKADADTMFPRHISVGDLQKELMNQEIQDQAPQIQDRVRNEIDGWGPLHVLVRDPSITEILVNSPEEIWIERGGCLERIDDQFATLSSYEKILERIGLEAGIFVTRDAPHASGRVKNWRIQLISSELTQSTSCLSLRRLHVSIPPLDYYVEQDFLNTQQLEVAQKVIEQRYSFLVIGGTGSGKTTFLSSLLNTIPQNQRCVVIEDTQELGLPNPASIRLLSRASNNDALPEISMTDLVRQTLRLRPDRIAMGEVRGAEAKDLMLALSTGHDGSCATLHAESANQALVRLEMLILMGAPQWNAPTVRRLIQMSLKVIFVLKKDLRGNRKLEGIFRIKSLEETGFTIEKVEAVDDLSDF